MDRTGIKKALEYWPIAIFRCRQARNILKRLQVTFKETKHEAEHSFGVVRQEALEWLQDWKKQIQLTEIGLARDASFLAALYEDLDELPDRYRRLIRAKYKHMRAPLSWEETANRMGDCTPKQAQQWHVRAVNLLVDIENNKEAIING